MLCSGTRLCACANNSQSEAAIIQKIYTHFKKTPPDHKLGVLYVVDSVTRQWVDQAKKSGQVVGAGAADGTFAAGATRVTELLPSFMNDIIATAPEDHKVCTTAPQYVALTGYSCHICSATPLIRMLRFVHKEKANISPAQGPQTHRDLGAIQHLSAGHPRVDQSQVECATRSE